MKKRPVLAIVSVCCLLAALPIARITAAVAGPEEDMLGYGALGVAIMALVITTGAGALAGLVALYRAERPWVLSLLATFCNAAALIWILVSLRA